MIDNKKVAWLTMLSTDEYLWAVLALNYSLKKVKSQYELVCACTENISASTINILKNEGIAIEHINYIQMTGPYGDDYSSDPRLQNTLSKISLVNIKGYDKLFFIDADMYAIKNFDILMTYPAYSMVGDYRTRDVYLMMLDYTVMDIPFEKYLGVVQNPGRSMHATDIYVYTTVWQVMERLCTFIPKEIVLYGPEATDNHFKYAQEKFMIHYNLFPKPWDENYVADSKFKQSYVSVLNRFKDKYKDAKI